ncbi:hypothetical protein [Advenella sp. FME57]|uniref:antitoxin PaaA2 family protein n=1 Tax=Advenella sp. FME57 TaxID=2742604 RepID=UPI0018688BC3|nr:hypothetical protein [Advenella sp. FME57]
MSECIDDTTLSKMVETGVVHGVHVIGQAGGWTVMVNDGAHKYPLATRNISVVRVWRRFETLVSYFKDIGLTQFEVDAANFEQDSTSRAKRTDQIEALKMAHEATDHDTWFREQVQASIDDPRRSIAHEKVKAKFAAKAKELRQRMKG